MATCFVQYVGTYNDLCIIHTN